MYVAQEAFLSNFMNPEHKFFWTYQNAKFKSDRYRYSVTQQMPTIPRYIFKNEHSLYELSEIIRSSQNV